MKTLEEHNAERRAIHDGWAKPKPNGIACPKCGFELFDSNPLVALTSFPAKKEIDCRAEGCGYRGVRLA